MTVPRLSIIGTLLALAAGTGAEPIAVPERYRVPVRVVATLSAPKDDPMHLPTDVAVDSEGTIHVADGGNDRIVVFGSDRKFERTISRFDSTSLSKPVAVAVDATDRLWIADTGNHRLVVVDGEGKLVRIVALEDIEGADVEPTGIALGREAKRVYVVDNEHHRLLICEGEGPWVALGRKGRSLGQFEWPFMVALGPQGYAYVTEVIGTRVQVVSPRNRWSGAFGRWGVQLGRLYRPKGLTVSGDQRVYVSDSTTRVVQVFSLQGRVVGVLTDASGNAMTFRHPMGMCLAENLLYIVETTGDRVSVVKLPDTSADKRAPDRSESRD